MTTEAAPLRPPSVQVPGLRTAAGLTLSVVAVLLPAAALLGGRGAAVGALVGGGLVVGFFVLGSVTTAAVAAFAPRASLLVALLTYTLQVMLLALVLWGLTQSGVTEGTLDVRWLAGAVIAGTLAWTAGLVLHALRSGDEAADGSPEPGVRR